MSSDGDAPAPPRTGASAERPGAVTASRLRWFDGEASVGTRAIPEETAVAIVFDASTYAVMMATPLDLEDFATGLSLTEGVVNAICEIRDIEIVDAGLGIEARVWLAPERSEAATARRRHMAGPTGCGLCGVDSLAQAVRPPRRVDAPLTLTAVQVLAAMAAMAPNQRLNAETRAVHAAAFWSPDEGLVAMREDVGRHNALDKLAGGLALSGAGGHTGVVLLTSRVSVEMVQKTAAIGAPVLVAVSAPTALAVRTAEAAGITLVGIAREDGFEVFTRPERIVR